MFCDIGQPQYDKCFSSLSLIRIFIGEYEQLLLLVSKYVDCYNFCTSFQLVNEIENWLVIRISSHFLAVKSVLLSMMSDICLGWWLGCLDVGLLCFVQLLGFIWLFVTIFGLIAKLFGCYVFFDLQKKKVEYTCIL
jgi:hypothetical protein